MKPPPARQQAGVGGLSDHPARWPDAHHQRVRLGLPYKVNRASPPGLFHVDVSDSREYGSALIGPAIRLHQPPMTRPVPVQPYGRTAAATREEPDREFGTTTANSVQRACICYRPVPSESRSGMGAPSIPTGGETTTEDGRKGAVGGQGSV